ncbi:hypothetical protein IG193_00645 [Infirmifilum lucidum]|uniref:Restriction endonuclease type IV Mrr domain-containing protein n=1 Tax=Infirmifilum lucidum TaxID=2776706 RepID=A0A7L9FGX3_9CREN|nr:hypothetical protein [Infirmifilum lucidum]QOJ79009.1 hypothetical protein IG193_00645 [Infirmifilum lucidum]
MAVLGSKVKARLNVCLNYTKPSTARGPGPGIHQEHENLKFQVSRVFEGMGYECELEAGVKREGESTGRVDVLCTKGDEILVVECKGYSSAGLSLVDLMQLAEYYYSYIREKPRGRNAKIKAFLAYRAAPGKVLLIEVSERVLKESKPDKVMKGFRGPGVFVVGDYCNYCVNKGCIVHA